MRTINTDSSLHAAKERCLERICEGQLRERSEDGWVVGDDDAGVRVKSLLYNRRRETEAKDQLRCERRDKDAYQLIRQKNSISRSWDRSLFLAMVSPSCSNSCLIGSEYLVEGPPSKHFQCSCPSLSPVRRIRTLSHVSASRKGATRSIAAHTALTKDITVKG